MGHLCENKVDILYYIAFTCIQSTFFHLSSKVPTIKHYCGWEDNLMNINTALHSGDKCYAQRRKIPNHLSPQQGSTFLEQQRDVSDYPCCLHQQEAMLHSYIEQTRVSGNKCHKNNADQ